MWGSYRKVAPQAIDIHNMFAREGESLVNDHVAFRTFNHKRINLDVFEQNLMRHHEYKPIDSYDIPEKRLMAKHFEHAHDPLSHPLIFVSEFDIESMNGKNQEIIHKMIDSIDSKFDAVGDDKLLIRERIWNPITIDEYESLCIDSEYASWVAAFGFLPNHFTLSINHFNIYTTLQSVNEYLERHGYAMNKSGGTIKGDESTGLMQSSTMAEMIQVDFKDGTKKIPGAYYEFAQRFVVEQNGRHLLFRGFVGSQANKIFESTDTM